MKLVERKNDQLIDIEKINTLDNLENSALVLIERGDVIKKMIKGARASFGNKNLFSVKSMKEAIANNEAKHNKKHGSGHFCCVCGDWFADNRLNSDCVCHNCAIN